MFKKIITISTAMIFAAQIAAAATYKIDPVHSQVELSVDHLVVFKVNGAFNEYQGEIEADSTSKSLTSAKAEIKVASIDTREPKRDGHLLSADFFDAENHPLMTFASKRIEGSEDNITVVGDLTIRGTTREVTLKGGFRGENTDPWGNVRAGFTASTQINRHDYGLSWNKALETGGFVVGDEVTIRLEVQGVRQ
jgi:polyisoprenoid-binding protein YceI